MRQRRFRRFISSISTLRSALIAAPANLLSRLKQSSKNDALAEKWKHYAQINADYSRKRANRTFSNPVRRALADMEQIEEQLKRERER